MIVCLSHFERLELYENALETASGRGIDVQRLACFHQVACLSPLLHCAGISIIEE